MKPSTALALPRLNRRLRIPLATQLIYSSQHSSPSDALRVIRRRHPCIRLYASSQNTGNKPSNPQPPDSGDAPEPIIYNYNRPRKVRHDAQEGNLAINLPFNPPGNGGPGMGGGSDDGGSSFTNSPLANAALTTVVGLGMVFFGGVGYLKWYKKNVLDKIELAFAGGYDPALELATHSEKKAERPKSDGKELDELDELELEAEPGMWSEHLRRREQDWVDRIIHGQEHGYFVVLGPKGAGKTTMIFDSMRAIQAEGVSMCDAHPDLEVFRLRLGAALNYEFNEDSQTGLFQRRDPREGGAALDIERALNKLEKVALRSAKRTGRPLVLIINNVHFFNNDEPGRNMLLQLQQRAESWAASGILTLVFGSDDFWPYNLMRQRGSRMHVVSVYDLDRREAIHATNRMRREASASKYGKNSQSDITEAVSLVGGRLSYLSKVTRSKDMVEMAKHLLQVEKASLLSHIGLIEDHDDDVMDEQKWSSCSWLLLQEFVKMRQEQEKGLEEAVQAGLADPDADLPLPAIPYWKCRQIMTRPDFLEELDRLNFIAIDVRHDVRPDSLLLLHAAREVVEEEGFEDSLNNVRDRVDEIESLHRTRELTFKDLDKGDRIRLMVDKDGSLRVN